MVQKSVRLRSGVRVGRPLGNVTRGTTNPNRMRRVDRWLLATQSHRFRHSVSPLAVDLGYGASPGTALEMHERLLALNPGFLFTGLEIEPGRVARAQEFSTPARDFRLGGFELPVDQPPVVVRAFNVLRQYDEDDVPQIWETLTSALAPQGLVIEGTCDELGRTAAWVMLESSGPATLTLAMNLRRMELPSEVAERLPKALIHRNVPGEKIHDFLQDLDRAWLAAAPLASFGRRQRWIRMCETVSASWPLLRQPSRWRQGELSIAWDAVAPGLPNAGNPDPGRAD